jgi:hypothetical protein
MGWNGCRRWGGVPAGRSAEFGDMVQVPKAGRYGGEGSGTMRRIAVLWVSLQAADGPSRHDPPGGGIIPLAVEAGL